MTLMDTLSILYSKLTKGKPYSLREIVILVGISILFAVLVGPAFSVSLTVGITFILATALAIYRRGVILRKPWVMFYIYVGVIFGYAVSEALIPAITNEFLRGSIVNGPILLGLYLYLRQKASEITSGEIDK